ncbi:MAG: GTP cyclohydrolase I FolE [Peptococcaceae bacterium]|jgi:GTP cyclohydrolase I|nr:GTP cyclohydrolase I FolE [Peptococcaceae bacterium]
MESRQARIEAAVREILLAVGEDPDREGLLETPARVARMYNEILAGLREDPKEHLYKQFSADKHGELVLVKDIAIYSMCEHHMLPFYGKAHIAYIPKDGRITGLSKLARMADGFARRLQVQERLTTQMADAVMEVLQPRGVLVVIEAEHMCMTMRGVQKPGSLTLTSAVRGYFEKDVKARAEAMSLIRGC